MKRTELFHFGEEFERALGPLLVELRGFAERTHALTGGPAPTAPSAEPLIESARSSAAELAGLLERVAAERASVHVFGPPNAGKSTMINALAGTGAAEVSTLPGYPCVVRVAHGERAAATLVRFDGSTVPCPNPGAAHIHLQRAHAELASRVRVVRSDDGVFDPARDLRTAVRRVDLEVHAEALRCSSTELYECPPIHGPLFAGYGDMLMGSTSGASAAIFVLRVPQLFDDTATTGVAELFDVFERAFLVVNIDSHGRDLSGEGELIPGLERGDPLRVVEVFEKLSTSPALVRALAEGRMRVVTLDLLEAARSRLSADAAFGLDRADPGSPSSRFEDFLDELVQSLDRHEALQTFVQSSLRRSLEVLGEVRTVVELPAFSELPFRLEHAEQERAGRARRAHALRRLRSRERQLWESEPRFVALFGRLRTRLEEEAHRIATRLSTGIPRTLEDWFHSAESVQTLLRARLGALAAEGLAELARFTNRVKREELAGEGGPEPLSLDAARDLADAGLLFTELMRAPEETPETQPVALLPLDVESIPVRPRFVERLTFRSGPRVRRALFGPPEAPLLNLSTEVKEKRLGAAARKKIRTNAEQRLHALLTEEARGQALRLFQSAISGLIRSLGQRVEEELDQLEGPLRALEQEIDELRVVRARALELERTAAVASYGLEELAQRFGGTHELMVPTHARLERRERVALPGREESLPESMRERLKAASETRGEGSRMRARE